MKTRYAQYGAIKAKTRNKVVVGLFVAKSILQGERIIEEPPLLTFPPGCFTSDAIAYSFCDLKPNEQFQISNLSAPEINGLDELTSIFQAHTFEDEDETRRFFLSSTYIRHSCCPNAIVDWNANIGCLTVHALRALEPTEELLICYVNSTIPFPRRWEMIRDEFGLDCACLRCLPNERVSHPSSLNSTSHTKLPLARYQPHPDCRARRSARAIRSRPHDLALQTPGHYTPDHSARVDPEAGRDLDIDANGTDLPACGEVLWTGRRSRRCLEICEARGEELC